MYMRIVVSLIVVCFIAAVFMFYRYHHSMVEDLPDPQVQGSVIVVDESGAVGTEPDDEISILRIESDAQIGIGFGGLFSIGDRVNMVNTDLFGTITASRCGVFESCRYNVEWDDGRRYWVDEELVEREVPTFLKFDVVE